MPSVRTPLRTRLPRQGRTRPDGQLRLPNRPGRRQEVGQPPVGGECEAQRGRRRGRRWWGARGAVPHGRVPDFRGSAAGPSPVRGWWSRGGEGEEDRDEEQCCAGSVPSVGGGSLLLSC